LTVNKTLTLCGAQDGVDARTRVGAESIVSDAQGTYITASNVVINGFTIKNSTAAAFTGYGLLMGVGTTGTRVLNNIIEDNIIGIGLANTGASQVLICQNLIQNNNNPGAASGTGIYTDQYVSGGATSNYLIEQNAFKGNVDAGIDVSNVDPPNPVSNLDISTNSFDMNGRAVVLFNTDMSTIHNNTITNCTLAGSGAIRLFGSVDDLTITSNDLNTGAGWGIRMTDQLDPPNTPNSDVVIHLNNIDGFANGGLFVGTGAHVGTVDAECNWWGSSTGPTNPNNPGGAGEEVVGDVDFTPWLTAPTPVGACIGGVSTPGKVTGGGQIPGEDPIFSPLGDLISLPAIMRSRAGPDSKATFGLTAKCCPASGNLDYNDHEAGVRIKAQSINNLFITSGSCGPNTHATFSGTAQVIRSTGATTEPFTVEVDDCGEPGTADTFGIRTTTYSNGPSPLIGGNIQIHRQ